MKNLLTLVLLFFMISCKKSESNKKEQKIIQGYVFNTCTGEAFPFVEIELQEIIQKSGLFSSDKSNIMKTITDESGNFNFSKDISFSDNYKYKILINSWSNQQTEFFGLEGVLDKNKISEKLVLGVSATFDNCYFKYPDGVQNVFYPDTFTMTLRQNKFHYYEPNHGSWQRVMYPSSLNPSNISVPNWSGRMGWWYVHFEKTKNGISSIIDDSIYFDIGESKEYIIPW